MNADEFIRAHTAVAAAPLVPEVRLHLAGEVTPLWEATEAWLAARGVDPPYWAFAWPGGQALARHVLDRPDIVRGRRVLDFAAGGGLVAIAARRAGAAAATAAEIDATAAASIALNAALNGAEIAVEAIDLTLRAERRWDVVLAGDVCYERAMSERVVPWLRKLAHLGVDVLLGDPGRAYLPREGLEEVAIYDVPTPLDLENKTLTRTRVLRLRAI